LFLSVSLIGVAQIPNGYYNNANDKTGDELKAALHNIIKGHTTVSYSNLWDAFWSTDNKGDGVVWDMYSDVPGGTPPYTYQLGEGQCGEYNSEGDCYNREHSWPQSWCNSQTIPSCDLHHIFPTDGWVNMKRGSNPFGEVQSASWTSQNGSKLGTCKSSLGYSGTVFEPIDAYKGDFARALMYMSVRYYGEDNNWGSSDMTNKSEILPWAIAMLMDWNEQDPVSQKEIDRNNAIYTDYQHNRNPFVDHPEYARMIWDPDWQGGGGSGGNTGSGDYVKITTAPADWSGEYLLVYENNATSGYVWTGVDAANCFQEAAITDYSIEDDGFVTIIIAPMSGGYSIRINGGTNDGKYINGQSGSNTIKFGTTAALNTLEYESDWVKITSNTSVMRFNNAVSEMRFRYYKAASYLNNNIESVQLYKKTEPQIVPQSISLVQGWNWWAPTVEMTLEALQAALGDTLMQIKSQGGTPTELVLGQMYRIQASASCQFTLSGAPATDVEVNIAHGCNWFGYPGTESLSLDDLNISPTTGDKVVSQDGGFAIYNGNAWSGTFTSLQPGKGYVYVSVASLNKTMSFE
jgi:endonuclease I